MAGVAIPTIETERLVLRGPMDADIEPWAAFITDPDMNRYLPGLRTPRTPRERAERLVTIIRACWVQDPPSDVAWVVTRKHDGQLMGWSGAGPNHESSDEAELVYTLGKPYWGQGYATEAARAVLRYGFAHAAWARAIACIFPANIASRRVLEHLGFSYERDVDYIAFTGNTDYLMDDPVVPLFALARERFTPGAAYYRVQEE